VPASKSSRRSGLHPLPFVIIDEVSSPNAVLGEQSAKTQVKRFCMLPPRRRVIIPPLPQLEQFSKRMVPLVETRRVPSLLY
jgi:hypothetical protein